MDLNNPSIQIYNNSNPKISMKVHYVKKDTDRAKFLQMCSDVLKIKAKRIFDQNGNEIHDISIIQNGFNCFISSGEEYCNVKFNQSLQQDQKPLPTYKISLLGMGSVGKSNLTTRWVNNEFFEVYSNTLYDKYYKRVSIFDQYTQVEISDTCGQEAYTSLRTQWMKDKEGLIFTYAINSAESFEDVKNTLQLYQQLFENAQQVPTILIVGNKVDLLNEREVTFEEGQQLAKINNALFFETSAKSGQNVNSMFSTLLNQISKIKESTQLKQRQQQSLQNDNENQKNNNWCSLI